jgi:Putative Actinobacterial Holin-X, holin superfamily III
VSDDDDGRTGMFADAREAFDLVKDYARQETLGPLKRLGRYLGLGLAGAVLLGFGVLFAAIAGLRALQTETGSTFTGSWSWAPYLIVMGGTAVVVVLMVAMINRGRS